MVRAPPDLPMFRILHDFRETCAGTITGDFISESRFGVDGIGIPLSTVLKVHCAKRFGSEKLDQHQRTTNGSIPRSSDVTVSFNLSAVVF